MNVLSGDPSHKSHNADKYPTMHCFVAEMYTHLHIYVTKWYTVGYGGDALWGLCNNQVGGYIIDDNFSNVFLNENIESLTKFLLNSVLYVNDNSAMVKLFSNQWWPNLMI